jgi:acyl-CoA thioester hydrolase
MPSVRASISRRFIACPSNRSPVPATHRPQGRGEVIFGDMARTHRLPIQIRFADTDAAGHINNAVYATYGEASRLAFLESLSPEAAAMVRRIADRSVGSPGLGLILAHLSIDFRRQVTFGQVAHVDTCVTAIGRKSLTLRQTLHVDRHIAAEMRAVVVVFDYGAQETRDVPPDLWAQLAPYHQD